MSTPLGPSTLLATFRGLDWTPCDVETWRGSSWPEGIAVNAVCCMLYSEEDRLVLAHIATRGWDVPGGRLTPGEDVYDGLTREVLEEVGLHAFEYSAPELLGWLYVCSDESPALILYFRAELHTRRKLTTTVPEEVLDVGVFAVDTLPAEVAARAWFPLLRPI